VSARKAVCLALLLAAPAAAEDYALPPPPPGSHVDYSADKVEFDGEKSTLHLTGGVVLKDSTTTVKGEDLWIDNEHRTGRSDKPVLVSDGVSAVYGETGEFDFAQHTGRLSQASVGAGDWRIHARQARLFGDRRTQYRTADFTSCDRLPPDYHFHASSVSVVPKKRLLAWNTFFYLGPVPLFYTPVFYKSLDPDPTLKWRFQPGYDRRSGYYIKGTLTTRITPHTYSRIFDDYYSNLGFGLGAELDHHSSDDSRGTLFGYRIHEDGTARNRWALFGGDYQKLTPGLSFQGRLQTQSDQTFNNDYVRSDVFRLTPELVNSAALTQVFSKGTVRLIYARDDIQNPATNKYIKSTESLPRLEAQGNPFRLGKLPWLNTFSGFAEDNYTLGRDYRQKSLNGAWNGTRSFNVVRGVSYTPGLTYSETYYNRFDEANYAPPVSSQNLNSTIGRWSASNGLRFHTLMGNIDATHTYSKRLKPDGFTEDTGPADKGVEANAVALSDVFVPTFHTWARVATGYDYRTFRDHAPNFDQRIQPITTDLSWQSSPTLIFTAHEDYQLGPGKGSNRSSILDFRWGDVTGPSVGGGVSYNLTTPGTYYQSLDFGLAPSSGSWRLTVGLRTSVVSPGGFSRAHSLALFEKEFTWTRRWHDFYTKVIGRIRPGGVGEITGRVELRFGTGPDRPPHRDWESEWFPGRANDKDDRP